MKMELCHLSNSSSLIVADASVIINLSASQFAADVLRAFPERMNVLDIVLSELDEGRGKGRADAAMVYDLAASGLIELVSLGEVGEQVFEQLVIGPASATLDDGEAATIAYAFEHGTGLGIDERKARRMCREKFPTLNLLSTVEIFKHAHVQDALGPDKLALSVLNALQYGRMRVLRPHHQWVVDLIGQKQAASCKSLPHYLRSTDKRATG